MIEPIILDYLKTKLNMTAVYYEIPSPIPDTFVLLNMEGRTKVDHIEGITIEILSYGPTMYDAAALDEKVREAMESATTLNEVMSCKLGGGNNSTDTSLKKYRYRSYFNLYL